MLLLLLAGCAAAPRRLAPPLFVTSVQTDTARNQLPSRARFEETWSYSPVLGTPVPCSQQEHDDELRAQSAHIATVNGRVVWLDLNGADAVARLKRMDGPVAIRLGDLDPRQLERVEQLAKRYRVDVEYEGKGVDLRPLEALAHISGLRLRVTSTSWAYKLPDLRGFDRLTRVVAWVRNDEDLLDRLPRTLEELELKMWISTQAVTALRGFVQLRRLRLRNVHGEFDVASLEPLQQLEELRLGPDVDDEQFAGIVKFPRLRVLEVDSTELTGKALVHLLPLAELGELSLATRRLDDTDMLQLGQLTSLRSLKVRARISNQGVSALQRLRHLAEFSTWFSGIDDGVLPLLRAFPALRSLDLSGAKITDAGAADLAKLTQLESLSLFGNHVSRHTLEQLAPLAELRELNVSSTRIDDTDLALLAPFSELRTLVVKHPSAIAIRYAAQLPRLQALVSEFGTNDAPHFEPLKSHPRFVHLSSIIGDLPCAELRQSLGLPQCVEHEFRRR